MMTLTSAELRELTGYKRGAEQLRWLAERLKIKAPRRADGLPVVSRQQVEAALAGQQQRSAPSWTR